MDPGFTQCNKRNPGTGCAALEGFNRSHAIFGASEQCIATHPSDMCVALAVLDASIRVRGRNGERTIPFADLHRLPGETPHVDSNLSRDELILSIDLPASPYASHSHYLKVRDRASYEFALVSAAVALDLEDNRVRSARIALGGVAHKPWRCPEAEQELVGKTISLSVFESAANLCVAGAKTYRYNKFKVEMAKNAVAQALSVAGGLA
jgi:xanthine dehydrogenase YagS FAD-binding subunit